MSKFNKGKFIERYYFFIRIEGGDPLKLENLDDFLSVDVPSDFMGFLRKELKGTDMRGNKIDEVKIFEEWLYENGLDRHYMED